MKRVLMTVVLVAAGLGWFLSVQSNLERREQAAAELFDGITDVRGIWAAESYRLASGDEHPLEGRIVFGEGEWQVVFFVLGSEGLAERGSAEGGRYTMRGDTVVFRHHFNLSAGEEMPGLGASPLRMDVTAAADAAEEPTRVSVEGDALTLFFPSGNEMRFHRLER